MNCIVYIYLNFVTVYSMVPLPIASDWRHPNMTKTSAFKLPDLDTVYYSEDLGPITLRSMLDGLDEDLVPTNEAMFNDLLWAFGAWETLADMLIATAYRKTEERHPMLRIV